MTDTPISSPASPRVEPPGTRKRVPMSVPRPKLEVPQLEGYFLYWHLERNVPAALQAGYEFVSSDELPVNQLNVATDSTVSGNADMGSHIRVVAGVGLDGRAEYHVLMKIRNEWRREDERERDERNAAILSGVFKAERIIDTGPEGETSGAKPEDNGVRYVDSDRTGFSPAVPSAPGRVKPLFQRPPRKGEK